jgi:Protein of unknown function (DUF2934)
MAQKKEAKQQSVSVDKPQPTEDQIRKRAYEIYCIRSGGPGDEVDDWLKAETELKEGALGKIGRYPMSEYALGLEEDHVGGMMEPACHRYRVVETQH